MRRAMSKVEVVGLFAVVALLVASGGMSAAVAVPNSNSAAASLQRGPVCAREVPSGSIVDSPVGRVTLPNGTAVAITKFPCQMTSFVLGTSGHPAEGDLDLTPTAYWTSFQDEWTTPPVPSSGTYSGDQFSVLYDGLDNSNDIVQPVLIYGCITPANCSNSWRIVAYALFGSNPPNYATPYSATAGDTIKGTITYESSYSGCASDGPAYYIESVDVTASQGSYLTECTTDQYQTAVFGSLEEYNLTTCTQMPGTTSDTFSSYSSVTSPSGASATESSSSTRFCTPSMPVNWNSGPVTLTLKWKDS